MPTYTMLIGVPGAGKSSWLAKQAIDWTNTVLASTDNIIEHRAHEQGKTYSEVFKKEIKAATREMARMIHDALDNGLNVIHDQTNVTVKSRADKLSMVPDTYRKVAVFFPTPPQAELARRLASRPGKMIPVNVVMGMVSQLEMPSEAEGFDHIKVVSS
jgi:predicted kinase